MAEANLKGERLKNVLSDFQKALECAICLEVVKKPFKLCSRGHLVCVACLKTIQTCPTCKGEFQQENPVCIQNLLECLPRGCRYSVDGCDEMIQEGDDHERFCGFRRVKCKSANCNKNVLVKDLHNHLKTVHSDSFMIKTCHELNPCIWPKYQTTLSSSLLDSLLKHTFCILLDKSDDKYLKVTFKYFPVGKPDVNYYAKITFEKDNFSYVYTIKAFPVEDDEDDSEIEAEYCMMVPKKMLSNFTKGDGRLCYSVFVFKD